MMEPEMPKTTKERVGVRCDDELLALIEQTRLSQGRIYGEEPTRSVVMRKALRIGLLRLLELQKQEQMRF
jgi:hypothetical protein